MANLDRHYGELKQAAAERLGSLFNPADYPETLVGLFGVAWDFPTVEPPDYLVRLSPGLYEQERARVAARFEEAVRLAEQAFLDEFARLVAHLTERITGAGEDGTPKVFRDSAVGNLREFFERFRALNVRSNAAARRAGRPGPAGGPRGRRPRTCATARRLRQRGRRAALAGPGVARRDAGRAAPAADPPAGGRRRGGRDGARRRPRRRGSGPIYAEAIDLAALGRPAIARASHVEPDARRPLARRPARPVGGPVLGPFDRRSEALAAEVPGSRRTG